MHRMSLSSGRFSNNFQLLFRDFAEFVRRDFHLQAYAYTVLVAAVSIAVIYGTAWGTNFELGKLPLGNVYSNHLLRYVGLYFLVAVPTLLMRRQYSLLRKPAFYLKSLFFVGLLSCVDAFSWRSVISFDSYTSIESRYLFKLLWRMRYLLLVLPLLVVLRLAVDRDVKGLYGLCSGNHHIKAYLSLYVVVVPLLIVASFTPDFLSYYPNYKPWIFSDVFGRPTWLNAAMFESVYMCDFIMVELFFRGALVIGMASTLGRSAVLPMITVYVALHFGKPMLESMSALFGGYFLGAMAYQTRHIWGGVVIHMGIALLIELLRFFEHYGLGVG
ncbi:MAG: CPBP family intramembrane metalloprotease [Prevotellaceae bacterium]|jgi:hypothetical protein|nr:CPBP family intramembrane metalloprotease [Prevotellaceae bacterium]